MTFKNNVTQASSILSIYPLSAQMRMAEFKAIHIDENYSPETALYAFPDDSAVVFENAKFREWSVEDVPYGRVG